MSDDKHTTHAFPSSRRSASAEAALRAEIRRVERMTIEERIRAALSLGKQFFPEPRKNLKERSKPRQ